MAYAQIIIQLWWKHGGLGWRNYDTRFRQQLAAGIQLDWTTVEPSILATAVIRLAVSQDSSLCLLCWESDHKVMDCALATLGQKPILNQQGHTPTLSPIPMNHVGNSTGVTATMLGASTNMCAVCAQGRTTPLRVVTRHPLQPKQPQKDAGPTNNP